MSGKPTPKHGLNLDELEEDGAIRVPYEFTIGGRTWTAYDPDRLDWSTIAALDSTNPYEVIQVFLEEDAYTEFLQLDPAPAAWRVKRLMSVLQQHFYGKENPAGE